MDEMMPAAKLQIGLDEDTALERITSFVERFGKAHLELACHAAFPLVLTPDMLYQIWASFVPQAPWTAVADVLLSSLCSEVGYELYEMDTTMRHLLLEYLRDDVQFGQPRLERLATFLQQYMEPLVISDNVNDRHLAMAQQWTALVYTQPGKAIEQIVEAFQHLDQRNDDDALRLASLVKAFSMPMAEVSAYRPLLLYATSIETIIRGDRQGAGAKLSRVVDKEGRVEVTPGLYLPPLTLQSSPATSADILSTLEKGTRKRATRIGRGDYPDALLSGSTLHYNVYYDPKLSVNGRTIADGILATCEADYNTLSGWFGGITPPDLPFNIIIIALDKSGWGGGSYHYSCAATDIYCDAKTMPNLDIDYTRFLVVGQEVEVFSAAQSLGWNCAHSNGEGLSRILSTELYPSALNGFASAASWLDSDRPDWINNTEQTDTDYVSIGCATLFLNYLRYQLGINWRDVVQAGGATLAETYTKLTGQPDALTPFKALLQAFYPLGTPSGVTTDNVFPLEEPAKVTSRVRERARTPSLTYRNGPLLTAVEVFTIFWGTAWQEPPHSEIAQNLNDFFDFILTSPLLDQLAEYSVPGQTIGHGSRVGSVIITEPNLPLSASEKRSRSKKSKMEVTDDDIQKMLQQQISTNSSFSQPTPNTLYFVYLPPGIVAVYEGSRSGQVFCAYHYNIDGRIFYAVVPFPGGGCTGDLSTFDTLTRLSSGQLCVGITDPIPGQGWYDDNHGEIGDICAWQTKQMGNYTVQLLWSNSANACI